MRILNKAYFLITFFFLSVFVCVGQVNVLDLIPSGAKSTVDFIPKGYELLGEAKGDLNNDSLEDVVMVLKSELENSDSIISDSLPPRILVVAFKFRGAYKLELASTKAILSRVSGGAYGDPFESIEIKKGIINVKHYGGSSWRWGFIHKFRLQKGKLLLIGREHESYFNGAMCEELNRFQPSKRQSINYLINNMITEKVPEEECKIITKKKVIKINLEELKSFNVEKDIEKNKLN